MIMIDLVNIQGKQYHQLKYILFFIQKSTYYLLNFVAVKKKK